MSSLQIFQFILFYTSLVSIILFLSDNILITCKVISTETAVFNTVYFYHFYCISIGIQVCLWSFKFLNLL